MTLHVGLTGGIASGKSTVARMLADLGAHVIDADRVAHALLEPGQATHELVVRRFGAEILDESGHIERRRLAQKIFADERERLALNGIVHPAIFDEYKRRIAAVETRDAIAVFDAALLVETGRWREFHRIVVVSCGRAIQHRRLLARDGMTEETARARLDAQDPLERKLAIADHVVDTEGSLDRTREQVARVWKALVEDLASLSAGGEIRPG